MMWNRLIISLAIVASLVACSKNANSNIETETAEVVYVENVCCENLVSTQPISFPEESNFGTDFQLLLAINLAEFNLPQQYEFGDTLIIEYQYVDDFQAEGLTYDCPVICDRLNGVPIELIAVR